MQAPGGEGRLEGTGASYDTVAASCAELVGPGAAVADVGCGPGHTTAHLHALGLEVFKIDLSARMVATARRDHPGVRFTTGSTTDLELPDATLAGLLAWCSPIHAPDHAVPMVLAIFHRVLRPGSVVLAGSHVGDADHETSGYGGHPMSMWAHRRSVERVARWLSETGFTVEAQTVRTDPGGVGRDHGYVIARRPR